MPNAQCSWAERALRFNNYWECLQQGRGRKREREWESGEHVSRVSEHFLSSFYDSLRLTVCRSIVIRKCIGGLMLNVSFFFFLFFCLSPPLLLSSLVLSCLVFFFCSSLHTFTCNDTSTTRERDREREKDGEEMRVSTSKKWETVRTSTRLEEEFFLWGIFCVFPSTLIIVRCIHIV